MGFSQVLEERRAGLSRSHRLLADYLGRSGGQAAFMTSFELAGVTGLGQSTVVRFAAALGYAGYTQFQEALRQEVMSRLDLPGRLELLQGAAGDADLLKSLGAADRLNIKKALEENRPETLTGLAGQLLAAARVYVYGQGYASAAAVYLAQQLGLFCAGAICLNLSGLDGPAAVAGVGSRDMLVLIAAQPEERRVDELLGLARARGARVAAITDSAWSYLGRRADYCLVSAWGDLGVNGSLAPVIALCGGLLGILARQDAGALQKLQSAGEAALPAGRGQGEP